MAENEDFAYQMNNHHAIDSSLITQERTAKLDLLSHLLSNSTRAIALCGPKGIGKTTLLKLFQQQPNPSWHICSIQGVADLNFEQLETQLTKTIPHSQTLSHVFDSLAEQHKKIVLIIDNAGVLAPYLMTTIINCAAQQPVLKVVFVLTHDDLAIKTRSDSAIEDCHIIEMPPLSETQCGDFLQHLALKSKINLAIHDISDSLIAQVYQQTHGIPASIMTQLPSLMHPKKNTTPTRWLPIMLIGLAFAWLALWILSGHRTPSLAPLTALLKLLTDK
jgi:DamX protein